MAFGSAPRLRGEGSCVRRGRASARISPAPAGRSVTVWLSHAPIEDQPRACGEKVDVDPYGSPWDGSAPRLRGEGRRE